jgi:glycine oxidase
MSGPETRPDLLVVGGGVIGLAAAREAALRGLSAVVLERGTPGSGATHAAAGMLSPLGEAERPGPALEFALRSLRMYGDWVRGIESDSGSSVEYRESGKLRVALSVPEVERLGERARWAEALGVRAEWFDPEPLRKLEGKLALSVRGALLVHDDFRVDPRALGRALTVAARARGVEVREGTPVRSILTHAGRARGVSLEDGTTLEAGAVLLAAGAWSATIAGLAQPLPVRPVRGQMLTLHPDPRLSDLTIESEEVYLVPRDDGRLLVGATVEEAGFVEANTADGVRRLLSGAVRLAPGLGSARLVEIWAGLRPGTSDGQPILGGDPEVAGLFYATGHYRNGILLAPATADALGALLAGKGEDAVPPAYRPTRLAEPEESAGRL